MSLVLDCSVAIAWVLPGEVQLEGAGSIVGWVQAEGGVVPPLWFAEVGNALLQAHRRRRIDHDAFENALTRLASLPLEVDDSVPRRAWAATLSLAQVHGLTLYDAVYLDLALNRGLALATLDRQLRQAATMDGIALLPA